KPQGSSDIITLQHMKTAALISFACQAGAIIGNASKELTEKLTDFGTYLGLAFQLTDDLLDVTANTQTLGKTAGKEETGQKATFVHLYGIELTQKKRDTLISKAEAFLHPFVAKAVSLQQASHFSAIRKN
ncbi:polyprenyl synthetase family protein, partial [Bartonella taylorii]|uniref:polyprenyl synthetase family protein n=1 Tax=Bartonella taylorii TaxID=33046 RepID=UPI001ABA6A50